MKLRGMLIRTDGSTELVEISDYRDISKHLECTIFTLVPNILQQPFDLFADDEGLLVQEPVVNQFGSWYYNTNSHGNPIAGNVLALGPVNGKGDNTSLSDSVVEYLQEVVEMMDDYAIV